jgi:hypothetical protein
MDCLKSTIGFRDLLRAPALSAYQPFNTMTLSGGGTEAQEGLTVDDSNHHSEVQKQTWPRTLDMQQRLQQPIGAPGLNKHPKITNLMPNVKSKVEWSGRQRRRWPLTAATGPLLNCGTQSHLSAPKPNSRRESQSVQGQMIPGLSLAPAHPPCFSRFPWPLLVCMARTDRLDLAQT